MNKSRNLALIFIFLFSFRAPIQAEFVKEEKIRQEEAAKISDELYINAGQAFSRGDFSNAEVLFTRFILEFPESENTGQANFSLALCQLKLFKLNQAEQKLIDLTNRYKSGILAENSRTVLDEVRVLRKDLDFIFGLTPPSGTSSNEIMNLIKTDRLDQAILLLIPRTKNNPDYLNFFQLGLAYHQKFRNLENKPEGFKNTGIYIPQADYLTLATECYVQAKEFQEGLEVLFNLVQVYEFKGEIKKAKVLKKIILAKYPESDIIHKLEEIFGEDL